MFLNAKKNLESIDYFENLTSVCKPNIINCSPAVSIVKTSSVINHNNNYNNINQNLNKNENWIKIERREILKKLLAQKKQIKVNITKFILNKNKVIFFNLN